MVIKNFNELNNNIVPILKHYRQSDDSLSNIFLTIPTKREVA